MKRLLIQLLFVAELAGQTVSSMPPATGGGGGGAVSSVTGDGTYITASPTTGAVVLGKTSELCGRGEACTITAARDMSGAGQMIVPRGAGAPSAAACDNAAEVGNQYINSSAGAAADSLYVCEPNGGSPQWKLMPRSGGGSPTFNTTDLGWWIQRPMAPSGGAVQLITALAIRTGRFQGYRALVNETIRQIITYAGLGATGDIRTAIYDSSGTLLGQSGVTAMSAGTSAVMTFSPAISLTPGYYYIGVMCSTATCAIPAADATSVETFFVNGGSPTNPVLFDGPAQGTHSFPGSMGARTILTGFNYYTPAFFVRP